jgi:hypothetical protein
MRLLLALAILGIARQVVAFPALAPEYANKAAPLYKRVLGVVPGFNANDQKIDTSGSHAFVPPGHGDLRGPCPGLNALANHNYLPHDGVATIDQFVSATNKVFGMGIDLAIFLSVYGAVMDGDLTSWSIGGPPPSSGLVNGPLSQPRGISYSHNKYEADASPSRGDLYVYGNDYLLQMPQFQALYDKQANVADDQANYDLDVLTDFRVERFANSIATNPYFFNGAFSGVAVQPAAYTFIYRFMANHSADHPEGRLDKETLKSFFAITGDEGDFQYQAGYERIPENWYKRAVGDEYTIPFFAVDLNSIAIEHPQFLSVGGNTGKVNTFTGIDPTDLTGGVYNAQTLLQGNNAACFAFQAAIQMAPDLLKGLLSDVTGAVNQTVNSLSGSLVQLGCPQLEQFHDSSLQQFPGYANLKKDGTY